MSNLSHLIRFDALGIPTPAYTAVSYEDFRLDRYHDSVAQLLFPVVVKGDYQPSSLEEEASEVSPIILSEPSGLFEAIDAIFSTYPSKEDQHVLIQTQILGDYQGEVIAGKNQAWQLHVSVGSSDSPSDTLSFLLPKFGRADYRWSRILSIWKPALSEKHLRIVRPCIAVSAYTQELLVQHTEEDFHGLSIAFIIVGRKVYILQASQLTAEATAGHLLTSASHKEILPPVPTPFMSGMIASCSKYLFGYYQRLDPELPNGSFIELLGGMPWINLSSLLDVMVQWGLPTNLITRSVGSTDVYRVKTRPYRAIRKLPVFLRVLKDQISVVSRAREWTQLTLQKIHQEVSSREPLWNSDPDIAFTNWLTQAQLTYVELVNLMQTLTGAISGPARWLERWGILQQLDQHGLEQGYLQSFRKMISGQVSPDQFLTDYGHRGFYESDLGQRRMREYTPQEWNQVKGIPLAEVPATTPVSLWRRFVLALLDPITSLISSRRILRHESMKMFELLRQEIITESRKLFGETFDFAAYPPDVLTRAIEQHWGPGDWKRVPTQVAIGWDKNLFLSGTFNTQQGTPPFELSSKQPPIGIVSGTVTGQIWKVDEAQLSALANPGFDSTILLTESLDPGWIPFLLQVEGVLSYIGGILSPASVLLRELKIPSITQIPREIILNTGDWVRIDGQTGEIEKISAPIGTIQVGK